MRWPDPGRRAAIGSLATGAAWSWLVLAPMRVLAASPTPEAGGDPRSVGEGPGLVGDPLAAVAIVALIGILALAATLAWVRATGGPGRPRA